MTSDKVLHSQQEILYETLCIYININPLHGPDHVGKMRTVNTNPHNVHCMGGLYLLLVFFKTFV